MAKEDNTNHSPISCCTLSQLSQFTVGICAIVKDADAYLDEWLDYHLVAMNIDNIYLYDHSKQNYLNKWYENTRNHPLYRRVHVTPWGHVEEKAQIKAYKDCILRFGKNTVLPKLSNMMNTTEMDYFALIDVDEFFMPRGNYTSVHGVVKDYLEPYGGALVANWIMFGSANKTFYKPIPVLKRFQYREAAPDVVIKTIVKASDFLAAPRQAWTTEYKGAIQLEQSGKTGASSKALAASPSSALLIYHYRYFSAKEYDEKSCIRGMVFRPLSVKCHLGEQRSYTREEILADGKPLHFAATPGTVFDESAWKLLCDRMPKYRAFDDALSWGDYT
ncbi:hypothetical protein FRACYDRAFT_264773 [Fragilariopsis cylindrus CCMP1102]|uniref:Glycosyltransferase family 92 protein n=1 Tax=Fragilariopsis cylindrus CCMP1102 TaxID=635003 RepID=A0A1E7EPH8_9STRA|nr:hypothetical protein FRACYDRAFT_264773 [Fragilariopsis cylindrus CCMP1102]|eukprot:OEU07858.1 hypothetical protein FRACYDRAFT_264773 [Fragilariopsis cylindrus CCMP1102]